MLDLPWPRLHAPAEPCARLDRSDRRDLCADLRRPGGRALRTQRHPPPRHGPLAGGTPITAAPSLAIETPQDIDHYVLFLAGQRQIDLAITLNGCDGSYHGVDLTLRDANGKPITGVHAENVTQHQAYTTPSTPVATTSTSSTATRAPAPRAVATPFQANPSDAVLAALPAPAAVPGPTPTLPSSDQTMQRPKHSCGYYFSKERLWKNRVTSTRRGLSRPGSTKRRARPRRQLTARKRQLKRSIRVRVGAGCRR